MDAALIQSIARLKIRLRQERAFSLNTQRFFDDRKYASQVIDLAEESENMELVATAIELRNKLGWLGTPAAIKQPAKELSPAGTSNTSAPKYVFGARS